MCNIPKTSPTCYLSGMAALNVPSDNGTGDWHMLETFFRPKKTLSKFFVTGVGFHGNTMSILFDLGIHECSEILDQYNIPHPSGPVYSATHARAIADMVIATVLTGSYPDFIELDDWMPSIDNKQEVFDLLDIASAKIKQNEIELIEKWKSQNLN